MAPGAAQATAICAAGLAAGALTGARSVRLPHAHLDLTGQLATLFDHQLAVADLAADLAGAVDHQLLAHGQGAGEFAMDLGDVDLGRTVESPLLRDVNDARVHGRLHRAFHHQRVAVRDLDPLELDVGAHGQLAAALLGHGTVRGGGGGADLGGHGTGLLRLGHRGGAVQAVAGGAVQAADRARAGRKVLCVALGEKGVVHGHASS